MKSLRLNLAALFLAAAALFGGILSTTVQAGVLLDYAENKLVDALLRAQAIGTPATWYVGLTTDACTDTGNGTEPSGNNYARDEITAPGFVKFYVRKRVGGKLRNTQAIKLLKIAAS